MIFRVPPVQENTIGLYDSIVGQELLIVDWEMIILVSCYAAHHA